MKLATLTYVGLMFLLAAGCATAPSSDEDKSQLVDDGQAALRQAQAIDPSLPSFLQHSPGYVVFPRVIYGAVVVGGSYGRGAVYERGQLTGYADITQATLGAQAGGQEFYEIIAFENQSDVDLFKAGQLTLSADVAAVALKTGVAESARYVHGTVVFVEPIGGLIVEAAVGGQQFTYQPK